MEHASSTLTEGCHVKGWSTANTALHSLSFVPEQHGPEFWQPYAVPSIPTAQGQVSWLVPTPWLPSLPASERSAEEVSIQGGATWGPRFLCRVANVSRWLKNTRWLVRFFFSPFSLTPQPHLVTLSSRQVYCLCLHLPSLIPLCHDRFIPTDLTKRWMYSEKHISHMATQRMVEWGLLSPHFKDRRQGIWGLWAREDQWAVGGSSKPLLCMKARMFQLQPNHIPQEG